jgi:5-methylcytosine-specific restriction protein B
MDGEIFMSEKNYWLLLCNPDEWFGSKVLENAKVNDLLFNLDFEDWRVRESHFKDIKLGDFGIIKVGEDRRSQERRTLPDGKVVEKLEAGIYAIFEVIENKNGQILFYDNDETRINIKIINNLFQKNAIIKKDIAQQLLQGYYQQQSSVKMDSNIFANVLNYIEERRKNMQSKKQTQPLNQILYGPPGTGKTYNTINRAIEIIENRKVLDDENREALKAKFEEYKKAGQIEFVTFHQSYGYEEFVEGIKAKSTDNGIEYKIESGILKKLTKIAKENFENSRKTNLQLIQEKSLKQKLEIFLNDALENATEFVKTKGGKFKIIELSQDEITIFAEDSNYSDRRLSIPIDEFYKILETDLELKTSRQMAKDIFGLNNQRQRDTYYFAMSRKFHETKIADIQAIENEEPLKNYILIIDEINRGNISKIFGELITLIETSKRIGAEEEIRVKLPYSGDEFGVPQNLYIIGTMNTADRSIALMDTALRRRFDFEEMMPKAELIDFDIEILKQVQNDEKNSMKLNIKSMLEIINKRVEYLYDRDHTIGHAYFMSLKDKSGNEAKIELDNIFRNKIIPLLQEYFYDDWEKILMVLGKDGFIEKIDIEPTIFSYRNDDYIEERQSIYKIKREFDYSEFVK